MRRLTAQAVYAVRRLTARPVYAVRRLTAQAVYAVRRLTAQAVYTVRQFPSYAVRRLPSGRRRTIQPTYFYPSLSIGLPDLAYIRPLLVSISNNNPVPNHNGAKSSRIRPLMFECLPV